MPWVRQYGTDDVVWVEADANHVQAMAREAPPDTGWQQVVAELTRRVADLEQWRAWVENGGMMDLQARQWVAAHTHTVAGVTAGGDSVTSGGPN